MDNNIVEITIKWISKNQYGDGLIISGDNYPQERIIYNGEFKDYNFEKGNKYKFKYKTRKEWKKKGEEKISAIYFNDCEFIDGKLINIIEKNEEKDMMDILIEEENKKEDLKNKEKSNEEKIEEIMIEKTTKKWNEILDKLSNNLERIKYWSYIFNIQNPIWIDEKQIKKMMIIIKESGITKIEELKIIEKIFFEIKDEDFKDKVKFYFI